MAVATQGTASNYLQRAPSPSGLADVVDLILDKGLVIDAYVRIAVIGIELITIDARIVIASVDTYLRFAEQVNRLDLDPDRGGRPQRAARRRRKQGEGQGQGRGRGRQGEGRRVERQLARLIMAATVTEAPAYVYGVTWADGARDGGSRVSARLPCGRSSTGSSPPLSRRCRPPTSARGGAICCVMQRFCSRRSSGARCSRSASARVFASDGDVVARSARAALRGARRAPAESRRTRRADRTGSLRRGRRSRGDRPRRAAGSPHSAARATRQTRSRSVRLSRRRWPSAADRDADEIVASLSSLAREVAVEERVAEFEVVRAAFLVERSAVDEFDAQAEDLARAARRRHPLQAHRTAAATPLRVGAMGFLTGLLCCRSPRSAGRSGSPSA